MHYCYLQGITLMKKRKTDTELKTEKLLFWYAFLRISKSYTVVTAYKEGKLNYMKAKSLVPDIEEVIPTYEKFGNVWKKNPIAWMEENSYEISSYLTSGATPEIVSILGGEKVDKKEEIVGEMSKFTYGKWAQTGHEPHIVVAIPLKIKKYELSEFLKNALSDYSVLKNESSKVGDWQDQFKISEEKVRTDALEKAYNLIMIQAQNRRMRKWRQAECLGLCPDTVEKIRSIEQEEALGTYPEHVVDDTDYYKTITAVIWRYNNYAFKLAENAARGEFPVLKKEVLDKYKRKKKVAFDYDTISTHTKYLSVQLNSKGMEHQYANEFLKPNERINRKNECLSVLDEKTWEEIEIEKYHGRKRIYEPLPPMEDENN
jgi:hypothetical protein